MSALPTVVQHLLLLLLATLLSWAGTDLVPVLQGQPGWGAVIGALVTAALAYVTPFIHLYGHGSTPDPKG